MSLDVDVPEPPSLQGPQARGEYEAIDMTDAEVQDDYRRDDLASFLAAGAWADAFDEWAEQTFMTEEEFSLVLDRGLVDDFDFYWDPSNDEVGYRSPTVDGEEFPDDEEVDVNGIENELDSLGRVVSEMLENDYVLRDEEAFGFFSEDEYLGDEERDVE